MRQLFLLLLGLAGGALLSQAPEFTTQYAQNLNGRVIELSKQVRDFERDARSEGKTVDEALVTLQVQGGVSARTAERNRAIIRRRDRFAAHETALEEAGPFLRVLKLIEGYDQEVAEAAFAKFQPAVPVTPEGVGHAAAGFFLFRGLGYVLLTGLGALGLRRREA